jgi:hypothetical protein
MLLILIDKVVTKIQNGEEEFMPILQVLDFKKSSTKRYIVLLSDGSASIQGIFSSSLVDYFTSGKIENGSLVQLNNFTCRSTQHNKYAFSYTNI